MLDSCATRLVSKPLPHISHTPFKERGHTKETKASYQITNIDLAVDEQHKDNETKTHLNSAFASESPFRINEREENEMQKQTR